jgi:hypothetical protein
MYWDGNLFAIHTMNSTSSITNYDTFLILFTLLLTLGLVITMLMPYSTGIDVAGDYWVGFTHLFILPTIYLASNTRWLTILIILTMLFSIVYHIDKSLSLWEGNMTLKGDEAAQSVLIWLTTTLYIFEQMPLVGVPVLFLIAILSGVFNEAELLGTKLYLLVDGIGMFLLLAYFLYKVMAADCSFKSTFFKQKRRWDLTIIGLVYFVVGSLFLYLSDRIDVYTGEKQKIRYNFIHSCWHITAYTSLFFILRSRTQPYKMLLNNVRIERTNFAIRL